MILVSTWREGVFALDGADRRHELAGRSVRGLTAHGVGGALAIVNGHSLRSRSPGGQWVTLAEADCALACAVTRNGVVHVGTDDARILRLVGSRFEELEAFRRVAGRETWASGQALIDGKLLGPPLGVRSMSATAGGTLLANVHVGGIPRSTDGGKSFHPTIAIESDVHEVLAHPTRPEIAVAAAAVGLCTSRDGGLTWGTQAEGLHASYCAAVAFSGHDVLVSASDGHFADQGRLYRRHVDSDGPLTAVAGLPEWTEGIVDTHGIAARGERVAFADRGGNAYASDDGGASWSRQAESLPAPSGVLIR